MCVVITVQRVLHMRITENCVFFVFICWGCLSLLRCENVTHAHNGKLCVFICWGCLSLLRCENVTHAHNGKLCVFCFYVLGLCVVITVQRMFLCIRVVCCCYGAKCFCVLLCYACVQQSGKQICNNNISLFSKGIQ